jgi:phosphatidylinositol alpha-1,6-mannosyltransferase
MPRLLVVTNDFPPRTGGIQSFVGSVVDRLPPDDVVVLSSAWRGSEDFDAAAAYRIVRASTSVLLPTPAVRRSATDLLRRHGCTDVWFGAAAPLGLLAPALRAAGARRIVATTHGHEVGWARLPAARSLLRRIAGDVDAVTFLGEFTRSRLAGALGRRADRLVRMAPGVDAERFSPGDDGRLVRAELGIGERPLVVCVSRLMARKGQDTLIRALPAIRARVPGTRLLCVGGGPERSALQRLAAECGVADDVLFTGSVPMAELPRYYRAGDVFAMPCRSRIGGLDVEGLGMVFLEASACGLPVIVGDSGGAPDTVLDGETGHLVDPHSTGAVAERVGALLADPAAAARMGQRGREWVTTAWSWERTMSAFAAAFARAGDSR